jgi:hypothetical protein
VDLGGLGRGLLYFTSCPCGCVRCPLSHALALWMLSPFLQSTAGPLGMEGSRGGQRNAQGKCLLLCRLSLDCCWEQKFKSRVSTDGRV